MRAFGDVLDGVFEVVENDALRFEFVVDSFFFAEKFLLLFCKKFAGHLMTAVVFLIPEFQSTIDCFKLEVRITWLCFVFVRVERITRMCFVFVRVERFTRFVRDYFCA